MKKLLLLVALASFATSASAQSSVFSFRKPDKPVTVGVRAGVNFSGIIDNNEEFDKTKTGFNVGVNLDLPIVQSLYIQTGLYFTTKGAKTEQKANDKYWDKAQINPMYLELPLNLSWRLDASEYTQFQVNIGPYFAVGMGGKYKVDKGGSESTVNELVKQPLFSNKSDLAYPMRRGDIGLGVGAGVTIHKIYLGFNYSFGFKNLWKNTDANQYADRIKFKNRNFTIQVGYNF